MNTTLEYYDEKAEKYFRGSAGMDSMANQDLFLSYVKEGGTILDLGCGSGRDSRYFRAKGYVPVPCDGSANMAKLASEYLDMPVKVMLFQDLDEADRYDGIFACASIMHETYEGLRELFPKLIRALKDAGILYVSFKYGTEDGYLGKRYYTYMTEDRFAEMIAEWPQLKVLARGTFTVPVPGLPELKWFHAVLKKDDQETTG